MNEGTVAEAADETLNLMDGTVGRQAESLVNWFKESVTLANVFDWVSTALFLLVLFAIYVLIRKMIRRIPEKKLSSSHSLILQKAVKYFFVVVGLFMVLSLFGIDLTALWGAAGIAGVAIGFAAQTSVSNLISGLFVITEGSIRVGDTIIVDGITGIVDEVKLLSVRVHTYDNQMVRIPNSTIIDKALVNNSYHKVRRMVIKVSTAYDADMTKSLSVLSQAAEQCSLVLKDPAPSVWYDSFGPSGMVINVAVWFNASDYTNARNQVFIAIKEALDRNSIDIPYDRIVVEQAASVS